jgi:glycosyltransferase involved in cell wall biosynthesis
MNAHVLVSSLTPASGGVSTMARFVLSTLQKGGFKPILAHYEPYGMTPHLSTPVYALGRRRPGVELRESYDGIETHAIGSWLPELEFTHFRPGPQWQDLMDRCDRFIAVSGNVLAASPFALSDRPFLAWVATGWKEDRCDRVRRFPVYRRLLDKFLNARLLERQERSVLRSGWILALSRHTRSALDQIAGRGVVKDVLPMPIDGQRFQPGMTRLRRNRIGFSGRFNDPRKNISLLLEAFSRLAVQNHDAELVLVGAEPDALLTRKLHDLGIAHSVQTTGFLGQTALIEVLQSLDVFVVPSWQEGLCIAALEAMACGCPVVSTRCGGPEEFVLNGETGLLVGFDVDEMADAIATIAADRVLRERLGQAARQIVVEQYNQERCEATFWNAFAHSLETSAERMN